jgi:branched-chain amino acid transport system substrate-binding protein
MDKTPDDPQVFRPNQPQPADETSIPESTGLASDTPTPPATPAPSPDPLPAPIVPPTKSGSPFKRLLLAFMALVLLGAAAFGAYYLFFREQESSKPHVKIGVMAAFTGGSSSIGYGEIKGIQLAKKQLGAEHIEVIQEDSKCDPELAVQAARRLIDKGVVAIIGDGCSSVSMEALSEVTKAKIPMVSPSASSPSLSTPNDYFFRVIPPDDFQSKFMAETVYAKGIRSVAMFYTDEPYGNGNSQIFRTEFERLGGKIVAATKAAPDVIELDAQIQEIKRANPQALYFVPNSTLSATAAIRLAGEAGLNIPYFGSDVLYDKTIVSNVGSSAEGLTMTSFPTGSKAFRQALYNEYQSTDLLYGSAQAYDAFHAIYLAIQGGAKTGEDIKNKLPAIQFDGVSARIQFDQNGEISNPDYKYDLLTVRDGEIVTVE